MHDGDVRKQILALEAQIERLAEVVESCRKVILISKAFTAVGGILMLAMTIGIVRFDPMIMIGALTAVIGPPPPGRPLNPRDDLQGDEESYGPEGVRRSACTSSTGRP